MTSARNGAVWRLPLIVVLTVAACNGEGEPAEPDVDLADDWELVAGTVDGASLPVDEGIRITLVVEADQVSGTSACNTYFGSVTRAGPTVAVTGLGGTDVGCEPEVTELEQSYLTGLRPTRAAD